MAASSSSDPTESCTCSWATWDVAAGLLMVQEAGGVVTDIEGNPPQLSAQAFVAGNPAMHAWLLQTVKRANMKKGND